MTSQECEWLTRKNLIEFKDCRHTITQKGTNLLAQTTARMNDFVDVVDPVTYAIAG